MLHSIDSDNIVRGKAMTDAIQSCVHCGFCLPTCPTYQVLGQEMDSPRGRIFLMKEVLEGKLSAEQAQPHIDRCLGCLACETSCPSGVRYGELISPYRASHSGNSDVGGRVRRWLASITLPYPRRFRMAMRAGKLGRRLLPLVPKALKPMVQMVPVALPKSEALPERSPAIGRRRGRVALLAGCAQQILQPDINAAAIRVLTGNGVEVVVPKRQGCCGALSWHVGDEKRAKKFAINNLNAFPDDVDAIVTTAAGCGSGLHDYPLILDGGQHEAAARQFAHRVVDVSRYLIDIGIQSQPSIPSPLRVAYHDACHLAHAQRIRSEPRELLSMISGVELCEIADRETCCGSAGTYNIDQPAIAMELGLRKARRIEESQCRLVAMGNIGCMVQIEKYLQEIGLKIPVLHTIQVFDRAMRGSLSL
ncbi:MAG: glycolate oxidase subunit GlcF [Pirellulaceae bacterium]